MSTLREVVRHYLNANPKIGESVTCEEIRAYACTCRDMDVSGPAASRAARECGWIKFTNREGKVAFRPPA